MGLLEFREQNRVYAKDQPEYRPLPAHVASDGRLTCKWGLTWRERFKVLWTGVIWHQVLTFNQRLQPQLLSTDKPGIYE